MNSMIKWRLNLELSEKDGFYIIQELFNGCKKSLNYQSNQKISPDLIKLYQSFEVNSDSEYVLYFSEAEYKKPFISTTEYDNPSYTIKLTPYTIYIYE